MQTLKTLLTVIGLIFMLSALFYIVTTASMDQHLQGGVMWTR